MNAGAVFPVKQGIVGTVPGGGGGPVVVAPQANFVGSPLSGVAPLEVMFTDTSKKTPTSWTWWFGDGEIGYDQNPVHTYAGFGTYAVTLQVQNAGGVDTKTILNYVSVSEAPSSPPFPDFKATPRTGLRPLSVRFTDASTGSPVAWAWDFQNDGVVDSNSPNPLYVYATAGTYDVSLTVRDASGAENTQVKGGFITVQAPLCTVPNFAGLRLNKAQATWTAAGFATSVAALPGQNNYVIQQQTLPGGLVDPPGGCDGATIRVGP